MRDNSVVEAAADSEIHATNNSDVTVAGQSHMSVKNRSSIGVDKQDALEVKDRSQVVVHDDSHVNLDHDSSEGIWLFKAMQNLLNLSCPLWATDSFSYCSYFHHELVGPDSTNHEFGIGISTLKSEKFLKSMELTVERFDPGIKRNQLSVN